MNCFGILDLNQNVFVCWKTSNSLFVLDVIVIRQFSVNDDDDHGVEDDDDDDDVDDYDNDDEDIRMNSVSVTKMHCAKNVANISAIYIYK